MSNESHREPAAQQAATSSGIGVTTGALLIVANMIGVGVFTTTGYMVAAIPSPLAILLAWVVGGVAAMCGALAYAELGAALPHNGGEYRFLSRIYHPAVGFTSGWASLVVGFAAPLALFAMVFGKYLNVLVPGIPEYLNAVIPGSAAVVPGLVLIVALAGMHSIHVGTGSWLHNVFTLGKVGLLIGFIGAGLYYGDLSRLTAQTDLSVAGALASPMFAVQLVYVSFAYSGWNTAAYLAGEFRRPTRDVPRAVLAGTAVTAMLYLGLNVVFLASAPLADLAGKEEVAHVAAVSLFGAGAAKFVAFLIMAGLVSAASANIMAGPRVYEAIGQEYPVFRLLASRPAGGGPVIAIVLQSVLAAVMLATASFDTLLKYVGVTLGLFAGATVLGVMVLRRREPNLSRPYRTWGYPVTPILFLAVEIWMIVFTVRETPMTAVVSSATVAAGLLLYAVVRPRK
jgi:APA family basic amino acid/polyamine antiporter